jgi:hypothetical protein
MVAPSRVPTVSAPFIMNFMLLERWPRSRWRSARASLAGMMRSARVTL